MGRTTHAKGAENQPAEEKATLPTAPAEERHEPSTHRAPCYRARFGRVEAAVWTRELEEGRTAFSVTLQRSYQDREGKWQRTASLDEGDMLPAAKALEDCYTWIQKDRQHSRAEQA
ncbi:MAG: hypothetical protein U0790_03645 [Isosphaeraceae bacterium]